MATFPLAGRTPTSRTTTGMTSQLPISFCPMGAVPGMGGLRAGSEGPRQGRGERGVPADPAPPGAGSRTSRTGCGQARTPWPGCCRTWTTRSRGPSSPSTSAAPPSPARGWRTWVSPGGGGKHCPCPGFSPLAASSWDVSATRVCTRSPWARPPAPGRNPPSLCPLPAWRCQAVTRCRGWGRAFPGSRCPWDEAARLLPLARDRSQERGRRGGTLQTPAWAGRQLRQPRCCWLLSCSAHACAHLRVCPCLPRQASTARPWAGAGHAGTRACRQRHVAHAWTHVCADTCRHCVHIYAQRYVDMHVCHACRHIRAHDYTHARTYTDIACACVCIQSHADTCPCTYADPPPPVEPDPAVVWPWRP